MEEMYKVFNMEHRLKSTQKEAIRTSESFDIDAQIIGGGVDGEAKVTGGASRNVHLHLIMALDREIHWRLGDQTTSIADRFAEVEKRVSDPDVAADQEQFTAFMVEHRRLKPMAKQRACRGLVQLDRRPVVFGRSDMKALRALSSPA